MGLDSGILAKIDRKVFAELAHDPGVQVVKVPVSDAVWSTWRRYCQALGLTMGDGVAGLIFNELETVVGEGGRTGTVFAERTKHRMEERMSRLDARERALDARAAQLESWEKELQVRGQLMPVPTTRIRPGHRVTKVGRNEPCPCGSGLKYKRCHGA